MTEKLIVTCHGKNYSLLFSNLFLKYNHSKQFSYFLNVTKVTIFKKKNMIFFLNVENKKAFALTSTFIRLLCRVDMG